MSATSLLLRARRRGGGGGVESVSETETVSAAPFDRAERLASGRVAHASGAPLAHAATVFAMIHGAGLCAHSFALLSRALLAADVAATSAVLAVDLRGHGDDSGDSVNVNDWSIEQLCADAAGVLHALLPRDRDLRLVLIGHSLGGAVATHLAASGGPLAFVHPRHRVAALVVLDVVEGAAVASLDHMRTILDERPPTFASLDDAIAWSLDAGVPRNALSARISVPPLFRFDAAAHLYRWRTPLRDTAPFWPHWFDGMSARFLAADCPRLLLLAADADSRHGGAERLDAALTAAHMQGRFQLELVRDTGHALHEDRPGVVAGLISTFLLRCGAAGGAASRRVALLDAANAQLRATKAAAAAAAATSE